VNTTTELPPLPIRVRPVTGESVESYIRRLARANHLRPSLLHVYVRDPVAPSRAIQLERLASVSGRTVAALAHALTGLSKPRTTDTVRPRAETTQAARKQRLFAAIRADAAHGLSIRELAARHHTHRRTVRQALASSTPPPRKPTGSWSAPVLDPIRDTIDNIRRDENLTTWQIWTRLVDDHDAKVSYGTVGDYIRRCDRTATPDR
jgi:TniQ